MSYKIEGHISLVGEERQIKKILDSCSDPLTFEDLAERLFFELKQGRIWLGKQRMLLFHVSTFGGLRRELIKTIGIEKTRTIFLEEGYHQGVSDAKFICEYWTEKDVPDALAAGARLRMLEGFAKFKVQNFEYDREKRTLSGNFIWSDSCEADMHLREFGLHSKPICWMQTGYVTGYTTAMIGQPIAFREVECCGRGAPHCRVIAQPVAWKDILYETDTIGASLFAFPIGVQKQNIRKKDFTIKTKKAQFKLDELIGSSPSLLTAQHMVEQVAETGSTVLLLGETGTGKEMFARLLHDMSSRQGPFVAINCAAIPDELFEAELFGVEKGAYTGANLARAGRFERAENGTLFLDEISAISFSAQGKLLRALQEREIERVGGSQTIKVNVRIVAASNVNLWEEVQAGRFREDLFFRLDVFPITLPPLKDRRDDIPLLIDHFIGLFSEEHGRAVKGFTQQAKKTLLEYDYPGNIRELKNLIERGVISVGKDEFIDIHHMFDCRNNLSKHESPLPFQNVAGSMAGNISETDSKIDLYSRLLASGFSFSEIEHHIYARSLERCEGNVAAAARKLGLSRPSLEYRLRKFGLLRKKD